MTRLGIRPNKGLGQNFLYERGIVQRMVRSARIGTGDTVVEIGPGLGILTDELLLRAGRVIAIELDRTLAAHLTAQFGDNPNFSLHSGDALRVDLDHVLQGVSEYRLTANLPYGVAAAVIRRFLEADKAPTQLTVMLQLEVAQRLVAAPPNMTILSVATQFYAEPRIAFHVPPTVFIPPPNVESAVAILGKMHAIDRQRALRTIEKLQRRMEQIHKCDARLLRRGFRRLGVGREAQVMRHAIG